MAQRTASLMRSAGRGSTAPIHEPIWYRTVLSNPPTHQIRRKVRFPEFGSETGEFKDKNKLGFYSTRNKKLFSTSGNHLFQLREMQYVEDEIREMFYTNHPWELARPRNMIESFKKIPASQLDWSTIVQPSIQLSGENVVQRTLWLSKLPEYIAEHGSDWFNAYEKARFEFYKLRMNEFVAKQVAEEEAVMNGAVFGPSSWDSNLAREQQFIEEFIPLAEEASMALRAKETKVVNE